MTMGQPCWSRWLIVVTALLLPSLPRTAAEKKGELGLDYGIFDWIHEAPGGFYHPDQEFRLDPETGAPGVFATKDIPEGTTLVTVPWSHIIEGVDDDEDAQLSCALVDRLAQELRKGEVSEFAPYIKYVQKQAENQIPSGWSEKGKELLLEIVGWTRKGSQVLPPEDPVKWLGDEWFRRCEGDPEDKIGIKAALLVIQRSDDSILIPAYDMYNHRNGDHFNTETVITRGVSHVTQTTRHIEAGEQINISYNRCLGCQGRMHEYGSAEILRDYGFVEIMPQVWYFTHLHMMIQFDLDVEEDGSLELEWDRYFGPPRSETENTLFIQFLKGQVRRLKRFWNLKYLPSKSSMPENEWDTCGRFILANIQAMSTAISALEARGNDDDEVILNVADFKEVGSHYDELEIEEDEISYGDETCDNTHILTFPNHVEVEELDTHYQELRFEIHPKTKDVTMSLDGTTQIASVYRPQYHEFSVHAAARYLDAVKRVIFIGGGDSMLLHEVLKYPELELVVGLELDQIVTRKSFKYFQTQPHFEDPRVEWWFGDATKSLLLLPEDYWQSFDLVLVDLSETVMSFAVTDELDVFDALALLLKPEGILVKNELYMDAVSQAFDYTVQICYQSPIICDQVLTMGSNKVDFVHSPVKDHGIENLLYEPLVHTSNRHEFLHDYRQNNATEQGKCNLSTNSQAADEQIKSAGIMEILEMEDVGVRLDKSLIKGIEKAVKKNGFTLSSDSFISEDIFMVLLDQGYIIGRFWPAKKFCSMDINLWGSFHKLKTLSTTMTKVFKTKTVSNFRVVVGGMYGSSSWAEDKNKIGPQIVQNRNCETETPISSKSIKPSPEDLVKATIEKAFQHVVKDGERTLEALVVCGNSEKECLAASVLEQTEKVGNILRLDACEDLDGSAPSALYNCEISTMQAWQDSLKSFKGKIGVVLVDGKAPYEMLQIVNSILSDDKFRISSISETNVFMAWSFNPEKEPWRRQFLDRYRKQHLHDPISRGEFMVGSVEFGIVSAGDKEVAYSFASVESSLKEKYASVEIELQTIYGGKYAWWDPWEPREFLPTDYDSKQALTQYYDQEPLAEHTIFQLEPFEGVEYTFTRESLNESLEWSLQQVEFECMTKFLIDGIGEGFVMVCLSPVSGSVVLTWDGRKHVDISYYLKEDEEEEIDTFIDYFLRHTGGVLEVALRDDIPRGTNRVVNFKEDMMTPEEREAFLSGLVQRRIHARWPRARNSLKDATAKYGEPRKVQEGTCGNPDADEQSCWPVAP